MTDNQTNQKRQSATTFIKINGILSIIFGALGVVFGLLMLFLFSLPEAYDGDYSVGMQVFISIMLSVFFIAPSAYLVIAGSALLKSPGVKTVRGLLITNIVIGAIVNLIILAFAIVSLTQLSDYPDNQEARK